MPVTFNVKTGDSKRFSLETRQLPAVIGRRDSAAVQLVDPWVSREHCELNVEDGNLVIRDLGSTYGTFVNRKPVTEAVLKPGDDVQIGISLFRVRYRPTEIKSYAARQMTNPTRRSPVHAN